MKQLYRIVISDYLQRTRSYAFLITLAISLYAAYAFVPAAGANYTTLRVGNYIGIQNAAWIGYVTAMMGSIFISMIGFYLVNSNIKKDMDTGVGMIVATTRISNFNYLLTKMLSNFLVLLSITGCVFFMGILMFFIRGAGYPFNIIHFILPYLLITIPAVFFIAALAVVAEVFLYRFTILMNIGFYVFFCLMIAVQANTLTLFDLFGFHQVTVTLQNLVAQRTPGIHQAMSMGFQFGDKRVLKTFLFEGIIWSQTAIISRIVLMSLGVVLVYISSLFFHRFDVKERVNIKKKTNVSNPMAPAMRLRDIKLSELPAIKTSYGIFPFIKTELLMLYRKGPRWLWFINLGGMAALFFTPLTIAHQIILPLLWFLQVARLSDIATKEKTNRIHYFTFAAYKPLTRLLPAQILAGILLAWALASPLMVRYLFTAQLLPVFMIIAGGIFIVIFAVALGILSGGKKLFEILFFLITYANIEKVPFVDYFGGISLQPSYLLLVFIISLGLGFIGFFWRKLEMSGM